MNPLGSLLKIEIKPAPHELSASVNEIEKVIGFTKKYGRGYWLRKCKGKSDGQIMYLLEKAKRLDAKYNKGGWLTNQLKAK